MTWPTMTSENIVNYLLTIELNGHIVFIILIFGASLLLCNSALKHSEHKWIVTSSSAVNSGYGNVALAMIGILWASLVSVVGSDLKEQWFGSSSISWESTFFATSVSLAILIGCLHHIGQQRNAREREARPNIMAVRCATEAGAELSKILYSCLSEWLELQDSKNKDNIETVEHNIRGAQKKCLTSMLEVAKLWDDSGKDNLIYKANLFNIVSSEALRLNFESENILADPDSKNNSESSFNIKAIQNSPFFLFSDNWQSRLSNCDYVMVNEQSLSVSIPEDDGKRAGEHNPICMPFSEASANSTPPRQPNLHGAPMAREKKVTVYIPDLAKVAKDRLQELEESAKYRDYISPRFKHGIISYYDENPAASVVSIPIFQHKVDPQLATDDSFLTKTDKISCVLNIYATKKYMFQNSDMANAYSDLIKTICFSFSILVSLRMALACITPDSESDSTSEHVAIPEAEA